MISNYARACATIDLDCIAHNIKEIENIISSETGIYAILKADAYGHGSIMVARTLEKAGADYLAVSSIDEAMELRVNGITMPILILGHTPKEQVSRLLEYNITQAVSCLSKAREYSEEANKIGGELKVHIKVDTGMSRLGFICSGDYFDTAEDGISEAISLPGLKAEGIFTHFAVSDEKGEECKEYTNNQFKLFIDVINAVENKSGKKFAIKHCANTGAVSEYPETYLDMVRPGLLLYGYGEFAHKMGLKPVMTLKSVISTIKIYPEGTAISYGGIFKTTKSTRVGVIPYGYADGFFRSLSNKCFLMSSSGSVRQIGKICMDMCMIDITDMPDIQVGSEIEIFGKNNSIDTLAEIAGTIPYELTCAVSKRVPRSYIKGGNIIEKELMLRL